MSLSRLIAKGGLRELATATHATHGSQNGPTVATVAYETAILDGIDQAMDCAYESESQEVENMFVEAMISAAVYMLRDIGFDEDEVVECTSMAAKAHYRNQQAMEGEMEDDLEGLVH